MYTEMIKRRIYYVSKALEIAITIKAYIRNVILSLMPLAVCSHQDSIKFSGD